METECKRTSSVFVCSFDGSTEDSVLQNYAGELPLLHCHDLGMGSKKEKTRQRILAWRLLEYGLEQRFGLKLGDMEVFRTRWGKPLSRLHPEIFFNISHCATAAACTLGNKSTGIDVERKFDYRENLARRVCHREEWKILETLPVQEREEQLHALWSMKESFVKMDGRGMGYGMERINLASLLPVSPEKEQAIVMEGKLRFLLQGYDTYTLAACMQEEPGEICQVTEKELFDEGQVTEQETNL